ncbi:hypothetical protein LIER_02159 [Lithospermum erythrorhizon]|uniref:Uncharacterized protein n=1 Tax=Lithospermum erythrorhizon TaxID=34254 RepID=A0AAV3NNE8_LITER
MGSLEQIQETCRSIDDVVSSPRISFSSEFLDDKNSISIIPKEHVGERERARNADFDFLSSNSFNSSSQTTMISADELFCEGRLLPLWKTQNVEKLNKINLEKTEHIEQKQEGGKVLEVNNTTNNNKDDCIRGWFLDDDPSPRPPSCTVLWKELLKLRKQKSSTLTPSYSSSSSSSTSLKSLGDVVAKDERKEGSKGSREKYGKRIKKGLERTRSATIRVKPLINVPICTQGKSSSAIQPLVLLKKGKPQR